jgi:hypothetical protein
MTQRSINIIDKIGALIPGYNGYKDRDSRKDCDKKLRVTLCEKLNDYENLIIEKINSCIKISNLSEMRKFESLRKKLNTLSQKILYTTYGSNAFFSDQKIKEKELDQIYQYDLDISDSIDKLLLVDDFSEIQVSSCISQISMILKIRNNYIKDFK